jgi:hypothetical protein
MRDPAGGWARSGSPASNRAVNVKWLPWPRLERTVISPPICSDDLPEMESPSPVPRICGCLEPPAGEALEVPSNPVLGMPMPVSLTVTEIPTRQAGPDGRGAGHIDAHPAAFGEFHGVSGQVEEHLPAGAWGRRA